jgi:hypothetical protein
MKPWTQYVIAFLISLIILVAAVTFPAVFE